jgi:hypothetical protein
MDDFVKSMDLDEFAGMNKVKEEDEEMDES